MTKIEKLAIECASGKQGDAYNAAKCACLELGEAFKEHLENEKKHYEKKYDLLKDNEFNQTEADKAWYIYHYLDAIINELFKDA